MKMKAFAALALGLVAAVGAARAEEKGLDNHAKRAPYYDSLKGKKVIFVPLASWNITADRCDEVPLPDEP